MECVNRSISSPSDFKLSYIQPMNRAWKHHWMYHHHHLHHILESHSISKTTISAITAGYQHHCVLILFASFSWLLKNVGREIASFPWINCKFEYREMSGYAFLKGISKEPLHIWNFWDIIEFLGISRFNGVSIYYFLWKELSRDLYDGEKKNEFYNSNFFGWFIKITQNLCRKDV